MARRNIFGYYRWTGCFAVITSLRFKWRQKTDQELKMQRDVRTGVIKAHDNLPLSCQQDAKTYMGGGMIAQTIWPPKLRSISTYFSVTRSPFIHRLDGPVSDWSYRVDILCAGLDDVYELRLVYVTIVCRRCCYECPWDWWNNTRKCSNCCRYIDTTTAVWKGLFPTVALIRRI